VFSICFSTSIIIVIVIVIIIRNTVISSILYIFFFISRGRFLLRRHNILQFLIFILFYIFAFFYRSIRVINFLLVFKGFYSHISINIFKFLKTDLLIIGVFVDLENFFQIFLELILIKIIPHSFHHIIPNFIHI